MHYSELSNSSLDGSTLSRQDCLRVLSCPSEELPELLNAAFKVRFASFGMKVGIQMLTNAKSGNCTEDCHYCSQSAISAAEIEKHPLASSEHIIREALTASGESAVRYCMALSGIRHSDSEIDALCTILASVKERTDISLCCSMGFLTPDQAQRLKSSGLDRVNHNLNTSEHFYPSICTSHRYSERLDNLRVCRDAGLEICSGGIVGQGESMEDVADMFLALRDLEPHSVPVNFFVPISGTPFENIACELNPNYCLNVLCLARFLFPRTDIRVAGGREYHLRSLQPLALYPANSIFVEGYLTTGGQRVGDAVQMIKDMGFELERAE